MAWRWLLVNQVLLLSYIALCDMTCNTDGVKCVATPNGCTADCDYLLKYKAASSDTTQVEISGKPSAHSLSSSTNLWLAYGFTSSGGMSGMTVYACQKYNEIYSAKKRATTGYGVSSTSTNMATSGVIGSLTDGVMTCRYTINNSELPSGNLKMAYGMGGMYSTDGMSKHSKTPSISSDSFSLIQQYSPSADWSVTGTRGLNIDISLDATPVQIRTDSTIGSDDIMWVRFVQESTDNGPGVKIFFSDPPVYNLGYCTELTEFSMSAESRRFWTIRKENGKIKLECNGEVIFDIEYATSTTDDCKNMWSLEFGQMKFQEGDTASDSYRPYPNPAHCNKPKIQDGTLTPSGPMINSGSNYLVSCNSGFTISGSSTITCTNGQLSEFPSCQPSPCNEPTIQDGTLTPSGSTIDSGSNYQVSCNSGFTISGSPTITCTNGQLSEFPSCQPSPCNKPTIQDGTLTPSGSTVESGSNYQVSCNSGFTISGSPTITCTNGQLSEFPSCKPSKDEKTDPNKCDFTSGDCYDHHSGSTGLSRFDQTLGLLLTLLFYWMWRMC
ncbi:hypothetical protein ACHWQZ_G007290 [Mnemiopsis leidyi]